MTNSNLQSPISGRSPQSPPKKLLTIGGSDSGGAAGIQADLKTWAAHSVHGMSALTVVTAQNSIGLTGAHFIEPDFLANQLEAVLSDYGADGVKTGFIGREALIAPIAAVLPQIEHVVVDPVLVNSVGVGMFSAELTHLYRTQLIPYATIVTPNWHEAGLLWGQPITSLDEAEQAASAIQQYGCQAVLVKRWRQDDKLIDVLFDGSNIYHLPVAHIETQNTLGSGDTLSASIAANLAQGHSLFDAVMRAQTFTADALRKASAWRLGAGYGPLAHF